ncbi:hypothetical protein [Lactococcus garvieae]|uniref:Uncharacterized protein n=1 Tax=Lactococcus garvieae TaxID=1363 RepID=A0AA43T8B9_9LACT|nr:hypothetical protein [Lactococcus garvieae]MDH7959435.1 hypothetical protein [Lactococcus garvieae]BDM76553.1 hypothetical protein LGMS210922A_14980 [Lactococcus garvieae]BDW51821.1 hypothetical protein LG21E68_14960 [Lactococcus garvieae]
MTAVVKITSENLKQDRTIEKEVMGNKHGMICVDCMKITDTTDIVRREYNKGLVIGEVPVTCEHCDAELVLELNFMKD